MSDLQDTPSAIEVAKQATQLMEQEGFADQLARAFAKHQVGDSTDLETLFKSIHLDYDAPKNNHHLLASIASIAEGEPKDLVIIAALNAVNNLLISKPNANRELSS